MQNDPRIVQILQSVEQNGMCVETEVYGNSVSGIDMVFPHVLILLCLRGTARIMDTHPKHKVKDAAIQLGFPSTGHFCRYFKRATGIYPQTYKNSRA